MAITRQMDAGSRNPWPGGMRRTCLAMLLAATLPLAARGQCPTQSTATVRMVTVAPSIALGVLDCGGRGPALVFLPGFGNTAHVFAEFAPRFTARHRVVGITRLGFGASS